MRLTSWERKGLSWGDSTEPFGLQTCVKSMKDKNIKLVNVIQVMLFPRILPCQSRTCNLWEFDPAEHQTLQRFFSSTHEGYLEGAFQGQSDLAEDDRGPRL